MEIIWGRFVEKTGGQKSRATVPLKSHLSNKNFCVPRGLIPHRTTFKFEYLQEFEPAFENVLGYELGAHMGLIHEKNQGPKIFKVITKTYMYIPFKGLHKSQLPNLHVLVSR